MKIFALLFLLFSFSYAKVYYAKVEPFEMRSISSNVSGLIVYADENLIGKKLSAEPYIKIDSEIDEKELKLTKEKLMYTKNSLEINEAVLVNLEDSLVKKRENYRKIEPLKFKSSVEKDKEFYDLITSENLYLNTKKEIQNLKVQISDLKLRIAQLERSIKDKNLVAENFVLYEMLVKPGQVVSVAAPLAKVADVSKALLTIYLDEPDVINSKEKVIYIDDKKTSYNISRLLNIADSKNISKYMAQIIIKSPKLFSKLVKVELRDE
ncbi:HlyD family secretion protein [Sulfurimonas sp. CVO]|jgi:TfoX/Sxy family transcriptional regulator of competence genes|uniref:HlyD family secretion protein n=1 Tax=Sulfurimonas xiamenensis TaxID=2590021 RepID=A0AAJ4A459_9BACT|nr:MULTISPECIES: HlyD family secretion protein [Sulfurimonas]PLY12737.1 MAG: HlyD family secretion protein [Sulfurimonas sp.]QFR43438.1 HlyD family secretion protein [Sulfurimonas xiamenensis]QHG90994.1 HlyD family secretion protein [Sulfurimonas sp. CVO]